MRLVCLAPLSAALAVTAAAGAGLPDRQAGDWPQFRGPARTGIAGPGLRVAETGPAVRWKVAIGPSFSTVVGRGDRIWTAFSDETTEYLGCFEAATGKELWKVAVGEVFVSEFGNGPRATPTLDDERVVLLGAKGRLVSAQASTGEIVWQVDLTERFGAAVPRFGYSGSALVLGDSLVLEVGGEEGKALAFLDRRTGDTKATALDGEAGYSSPMVATLAGREQLLLARGKTILGLGTDGATLWSHEMDGGVVAMPVPIGGDRLFVSAGDDTGCALLRVKREGEGLAVEKLWANRDMRNHFNSSLLVDGVIYGFDNATLKALDAETGELLWGKRGLGKGSLAASGSLIVVLTDKGIVNVVRASRQDYEELGSVAAIEGKSWTSPSIVGGRVFVRNLEQMACIEPGG